jgi:CBS domain-containing protein
MARMDELSGVDEDEWESAAVARIMRADLPTAKPAWTLREAVAAMQEADVDRLPVVDGGGRFIGVVSTSDILKLDEILDAQSDSRGG